LAKAKGNSTLKNIKMSENEIKWGIIGLGNIAEHFARDLALIPNAQLYAVASRSLEKATKFGAKFSATKSYGDYDSLINDDQVDIIYIATPHDSHASLSIQALNAKKHVLCEKPIAINYAQASQMIAASRENNRFFMEAFWTRFNPTFTAVLSKVRAGELGKIQYINADFGFIMNNGQNRLEDVNLGGGSLLDMGVYPLFLSYMILGKPEKVMASSLLYEGGADKQTTMLLNYPTAQAVLHSSFIARTNMHATISGEKGRIVIDPLWHEAQSFSLFQDEVETKFDLPTKGKGFTYEIEECHQCIASNKIESTVWSHQNSLDLITIADQVRREAGIIYPVDKI
jgi:predicted dehydrogenase